MRDIGRDFILYFVFSSGKISFSSVYDVLIDVHSNLMRLESSCASRRVHMYQTFLNTPVQSYV